MKLNKCPKYGWILTPRTIKCQKGKDICPIKGKRS